MSNAWMVRSAIALQYMYVPVLQGVPKKKAC